MEERSREQILREHGLWEGWASLYDAVPLSPDKVLDLGTRQSMPDPEVIGFAFPLPPVDFSRRNERKFPPLSEEEAFREMFNIVRGSLHDRQYDRCSVLAVLYDMINSNRRDSPRWQRAFLEVGGLECLLELWRCPEHDLPSEVAFLPGGVSNTQAVRSVHYWIVALLGRMMGTCEASRRRLIEEGAVDVILEAARSSEDDVRECAVCSLKGLIQYPEGREQVTYQTLIDCLGDRGR